MYFYIGMEWFNIIKYVKCFLKIKKSSNLVKWCNNYRKDKNKKKELKKNKNDAF